MDGFQKECFVCWWRRRVKHSDIPLVCVSCRDIRVFLMSLRVSQDDVGKVQTAAVQADRCNALEIRGRYVGLLSRSLFFHVEVFQK